MDYSDFRKWLNSRTKYSNRVIGNIVCRLKRADRMLPLRPEEVYLFELEHTHEFKELTITVKSQIRKAVKLYLQYVESGIVEELK